LIEAIKVTSTAHTDTGSIAYVRQQHNGIKFANAVANAAFNKNNNVIAFGSSFVKPDSIASSTPKISQQQAIKVAADDLGGAYNKKPVGLEYVSRVPRTGVTQTNQHVHIGRQGRQHCGPGPCRRGPGRGY
jgi:Zn-dependent metalloprotease